MAEANDRRYLQSTALPGDTMSRQGVDVALGRLHSTFASNLANAIRQARAEGVNASAFSAYRPPSYGVGGYRNKFNSLHAYGLAVDMAGIGAAGSSTAKRWQEIAEENGLYNPYGYKNRAEWNHFQGVPEKGRQFLEAHPELRESIIAQGPENLEAMWQASGIPFTKPVDPFGVHAFQRERMEVDAPLTGSRIKDAQRVLKDKGFYEGSIDGQWGPQSTAAMQAFAESIGAESDGKLTGDALQLVEAVAPKGGFERDAQGNPIPPEPIPSPNIDAIIDVARTPAPELIRSPINPPRPPEKPDRLNEMPREDGMPLPQPNPRLPETRAASRDAAPTLADILGEVPMPPRNPRQVAAEGMPLPPANPRRDPMGFRYDTSRVALRNADGSLSAEKVASFRVGDSVYNIPTIVDGKQLTPDKAYQEFVAGRNPPVQGPFPDENSARQAAILRASTHQRARDTDPTAGEVNNTVKSNIGFPSGGYSDFGMSNDRPIGTKTIPGVMGPQEPPEVAQRRMQQELADTLAEMEANAGTPIDMRPYRDNPAGDITTGNSPLAAVESYNPDAPPSPSPEVRRQLIDALNDLQSPRNYAEGMDRYRPAAAPRPPQMPQDRRQRLISELEGLKNPASASDVITAEYAPATVPPPAVLPFNEVPGWRPSAEVYGTEPVSYSDALAEEAPIKVTAPTPVEPAEKQEAGGVFKRWRDGQGREHTLSRAGGLVGGVMLGPAGAIAGSLLGRAMEASRSGKQAAPGAYGYTPTSSGVTPGGQAWTSGADSRGNTMRQWNNSRGTTVTTKTNPFGSGESVGFG